MYPGETEVRNGSSLTLSCVAHGYPLPSLVWLREGYPEPDFDNVTEVELVPNFLTSMLELCSVELFDSGVYKCVANNSISSTTGETLSNSDTLQFNLTVLSKINIKHYTVITVNMLIYTTT